MDPYSCTNSSLPISVIWLNGLVADTAANRRFPGSIFSDTVSVSSALLYYNCSVIRGGHPKGRLGDQIVHSFCKLHNTSQGSERSVYIIVRTSQHTDYSGGVGMNRGWILPGEGSATHFLDGPSEPLHSFPMDYLCQNWCTYISTSNVCTVQVSVVRHNYNVVWRAC